MSRTLCCPVRIGKHGRSGKTKKEFETVATKAGVIWFVDEDEVVKRILEVVCRDEIGMAITYQEAKNMTHSRRKSYQKTKERWPLFKGSKFKHLM